jgi:hypothetical protein
MAAANADVLPVAIAFGKQVVGVHPKEAGEGVSDTRDAGTLEDGLLAPGAAVTPFKERAVVDAMAKQPAPQPVDRTRAVSRVEVERGDVAHVF